MTLSKSVKKVVISLAMLTLLLITLFFALAYGWLGKHDGPGNITNQRIPMEVIQERASTQAQAASNIDENNTKQILFGDLHAHTTL